MRTDLVRLVLRTPSGNLTATPETYTGRWVSPRPGGFSATIRFEPAGVGWYWVAHCDQGGHHVGSASPKANKRPRSLQDALAEAETRCSEYFLED